MKRAQLRTHALRLVAVLSIFCTAGALAAQTTVPSLPKPTAPPIVQQENGKPIWSVYVGNDTKGTAIPAFEKWFGRPTDGILAYTGDAN